MVIETDRLKIKDVSMLQMKNYIDFIWRKETNKYKFGRVINENRALVYRAKEQINSWRGSYGF